MFIYFFFLVAGKFIILRLFTKMKKREKRVILKVFSLNNCVIYLYTTYFVPVTRGCAVRLETRSI